MIVKTLDNGTVEFNDMGHFYEIVTRCSAGTTISSVRATRERAESLRGDMLRLLHGATV